MKRLTFYYYVTNYSKRADDSYLFKHPSRRPRQHIPAGIICGEPDGERGYNFPFLPTEMSTDDHFLHNRYLAIECE
jgi:hypothetical protein